MFSENRLSLALTDAMLPSESLTIESFEKVVFDGIFPREYEDAKTRLTAFLTREAVKPGNETMAPRLIPLAMEISKLAAEGSLYFLNVPALIPLLIDAAKKDGSALSVASLVRHIHLVCDRRASRKDEAAGMLSERMAAFATLSRAQLGRIQVPSILILPVRLSSSLLRSTQPKTVPTMPTLTQLHGHPRLDLGCASFLMVPDLILDPPSNTRWFCSLNHCFAWCIPNLPANLRLG